MAPAWSPTDGKLHFLTDTSGWWNLYREDSPGSVAALCPIEGAEFGGPAWGLGGSPYAFLPDGRILCVYGGPAVEGGSQLALLDTSTGTLSAVPMPPHSSLGDVSVSTGPGGEGVMVAMVAGSSSEPSEVRAALLPADTSAPWEWRSFRASSDVSIEPGYLAAPQQMEFPTSNRGESRTAHLIFYPPTNQDYSGGADGELPPLLVKSHGGPTSSASSAFSLNIRE